MQQTTIDMKAMLANVAQTLASAGQKTGNVLSEDEVTALLEKCCNALGNVDAQRLLSLIDVALAHQTSGEAALVQPGTPVNVEVTEVRPQSLECDVVRFQNNKEKWVALVGLLNGYPYEIFTGLQDDDEGIMLPKSVTKGRILKQVNGDGSKRYDFQFTNTRGYKITIEGLSEKFNPEYWNYAKLISGVLRYRMPLDHVIKLVASLQLKSESINTWKNGVERALKRYLPGSAEAEDTLADEHDDDNA